MGIEELFRDTTLSPTSSYRTHLCFWNLLEIALCSLIYCRFTSLLQIFILN